MVELDQWYSWTNGTVRPMVEFDQWYSWTNGRVRPLRVTLIIIIIINIIKGWQCKAGRERLTSISPKTPAPQYQPYRMKEEKGKTAGEKGELAARQ